MKLNERGDFSFQKIKKEHWLLATFFFLGLIFITETIGLLDFWLDEAAVYIALQNSFFDLGPITAQYAQQFLHNFALKAWTLIWGDGPVAIRSFSSFCYFLTIFVVYQAGSYFFRSKRIGLLAAFLWVTNYFAIWYSIESKVYTLAALLGLLSFYFFVRCAQEGKKKDYFFYFLFSGLGFYAHPWLMLVFSSQILGLLVLRKNFVKIFPLLLTQFFIFLSSLPFLFLSLKQSELGVNSYAGTVDWSVLWQSLLYLSFGSYWEYLGLTLVALLFVLFKKQKMKKIFLKECSATAEKKNFSDSSFLAKEKRINVLLSFYLFIPLLTAAGISHFIPAYVVGRYEMVVLPAFLLLLANLWSKIKEKIWLILLGVLLLCSAFNNILSYRESISSYKSTDRTVIEDICQEAKEGDYIITTDLSWATAYYYLTTTQKSKKINLVAYPKQIDQQVVWINLEEMNKEENRERYAKEVEELLERIKNDGAARQIFVLYRSGFPINELLKDRLQTDFNLVSEDYLETPREPSWYDFVLKYEKVN